MLYLCNANEGRINLAQAQWPMRLSDRDNSLMRTLGFARAKSRIRLKNISIHNSKFKSTTTQTNSQSFFDLMNKTETGRLRLTKEDAGKLCYRGGG